MRAVAFILTLLAALLLALGLALSGLFVWNAALALLLALWVFFFLRRASWAATLGFGLVCAFAVAGVFYRYQLSGAGMDFALLLPSVLLALAGYDLAELEARLKISGELDESYLSRLRRYYLRLGLLILLGAGLAVFGYAWKTPLSFVWMVTLSIFGALGLAGMARILLSRQD
jgi:hypothetical protein